MPLDLFSDQQKQIDDTLLLYIWQKTVLLWNINSLCGMFLTLIFVLSFLAKMYIYLFLCYNHFSLNSVCVCIPSLCLVIYLVIHHDNIIPSSLVYAVVFSKHSSPEFALKFQRPKLNTILPSVTRIQNTSDSTELPRNMPVTTQPHAMKW